MKNSRKIHKRPAAAKVQKVPAKKYIPKKAGTGKPAPKTENTNIREHSKIENALVYITGEAPMVEQYAEICIAHGYSVSISWNEPYSKNHNSINSKIAVAGSVPKNTSIAIELTNIDISAKKKNLEKLAKALPETAPIISSSINITATEQSAWIAGKHRLVGIAALPTFINKPAVEVAPTIYTPKETLEVVSHFFRTIGKEIEIVQDRIGMVLPRILCQIINESAFAITEDIAAPEDIDKAMMLCRQFPQGPVKWAEQIGLDQVYAVLSALHSDLHEERYRIAPILKQMALTGVWWQQSVNQKMEEK